MQFQIHRSQHFPTLDYADQEQWGWKGGGYKNFHKRSWQTFLRESFPPPIPWDYCFHASSSVSCKRSLGEASWRGGDVVRASVLLWGPAPDRQGTDSPRNGMWRDVSGGSCKVPKLNLRLWRAVTHLTCSLRSSCLSCGGKLASQEEVKGFEDAFSFLLVQWETLFSKAREKRDYGTIEGTQNPCPKAGKPRAKIRKWI